MSARFARALLACLVLLLAPLAHAEKPAAPAARVAPDRLSPLHFDECFTGIVFGQTRADTIAYRQARLKAQFDERILAERSANEKDALKRRAQAEIGAVAEGSVEFGPGTSGFDATVVSRDFARGADESGYVATKGNDRVYFFYSRDSLWRVAYVLDTGESYEDLLARLEMVYGKGKPGQRSEDGVATVSWTDDVFRVELTDERKQWNAYVLRWTAAAAEAAVQAYRAQKGASTAAAAGSDLGADDVLNMATEKGTGNVDNVVDDILGQKPKPVPDVAGQKKKKRKVIKEITVPKK